MTLTIRSLTEELGLGLTVDARADTPVRWVHISELEDPTPWLSGGELLLTTGLQLGDEASQRAFAGLLADHSLSGIGFGTGFAHERVPPALLDEARRRELPVFEVPYEMPFIAVTEKAFARLVSEDYEVLRRATAVQKRLELLVLSERGLDELVKEIATTIGGDALVLDAGGHLLASNRADPALPAELSERQTTEELMLPISARGRGAPQAWLLARRGKGAVTAFDRLILEQATIVVALELMRQRVMRDTERRLAGDVLAEAVGGRLGEREVMARLRPFGIDHESVVMVFACADPHAAELDLEALLSEAGLSALVASREQLLCAIVAVPEEGAGELIELAARTRRSLDNSHGPVTAAISRAQPAGVVRHSFNEARCALEAATLGNGAAHPEVASYQDLGAFQLLLSLQDDEALRLYCESVLAPLRKSGDEYGDELLRSVETFIECNGQWERAARELYCHRHTLRYRIKRVEELTGRDMSSARDRIEFWLALRARELVT